MRLLVGKLSMKSGDCALGKRVYTGGGGGGDDDDDDDRDSDNDNDNDSVNNDDDHHGKFV